jgi:hypothetical protein
MIERDDTRYVAAVRRRLHFGVGLIVFGVVGALSVPTALLVAARLQTEFERSADRVRGTVIDVYDYARRGADVTVRFRYQGAVRHERINVGGDGGDVGDRVAVFIDPDDPQDVRLDDQDTVTGWVAVVGAVGSMTAAAGLIWGVIVVRDARRQRTVVAGSTWRQAQATGYVKAKVSQGVRFPDRNRRVRPARPALLTYVDADQEHVVALRSVWRPRVPSEIAVAGPLDGTLLIEFPDKRTLRTAEQATSERQADEWESVARRAPTVPSLAAAGWYPDPRGRHDHRYWDGATWTAHVADAGVADTDPV